MGAHSHETLEFARVWSVVQSEASEPIVVPYVVETKGGKLRKLTD